MHAQIMEPLIYDPLGQPLYKGPLYKSISPISVLIHSQLSERGQPPTRDKMAGPKVSFTHRFHCIYKTYIYIDIIIIDYYTVSEYLLLLLLTILSSGTHVIAIIINIGITSLLLLLLLLLLLFMYRLLTSLKHLPRML